MAALMFGLEISSVPAILPTLEAVLHSSFNDLQWIMNAYTIACTMVLMAIGTLADRYGRKRVFMISLVLFGMTSLTCGLAQNNDVLIASRFLQGMAAGAMLICQVAVLSHRFQSAAARGKAFSAWGIVFGMGLGFGPIIGAGIVAVSSWEWVFLVHAPIAVLALGLVIAGVDESKDPQRRRLDLLGMTSLSLAVLGLSWFLTQGAATGFSTREAMFSLLLAVVSVSAFVLSQRRGVDPMFDFSVLRIPRFSGALVGAAAMNFSFWPFMIYLPLYFQNSLGYSSVGTGLALLAYTLPTLVVPPIGERLALRYKAEGVIVAGLFTIGLGFWLMNWGRILAAVGRAGVPELDVSKIDVFLGDVCIASRGARAETYTEAQGSAVMQQEEITIRIELGRGDCSETIWTTDLSHEYVKINAEYRT